MGKKMTLDKRRTAAGVIAGVVFMSLLGFGASPATAAEGEADPTLLNDNSIIEVQSNFDVDPELTDPVDPEPTDPVIPDPLLLPVSVAFGEGYFQCDPLSWVVTVESDISNGAAPPLIVAHVSQVSRFSGLSNADGSFSAVIPMYEEDFALSSEGCATLAVSWIDPEENYRFLAGLPSSIYDCDGFDPEPEPTDPVDPVDPEPTEPPVTPTPDPTEPPVAPAPDPAPPVVPVPAPAPVTPVSALAETGSEFSGATALLAFAGLVALGTGLLAWRRRVAD